MMIVLNRQIASLKSTIGTLTCGSTQCETLEDPKHIIKIYGNTCIPEGQYAIKLRTEGGKHAKYLARFGPDFHKGMLWLQDVPGFEYIYIHIGNTPQDTLGCILVGASHDGDRLLQSEATYRVIYPMISSAILAGDDTMIDVINRTR